MGPLTETTTGFQLVTKVGNRGVGNLSDGDHRRILDPSLTALQFKIASGAFTDNITFGILPETTINLTDNASNIIVIDVVNSTYALSADLTSEGRIALYTVVTASGVISTVTDHRSMFVTKSAILDFETVISEFASAPVIRFNMAEASGNISTSGSHAGGDLTVAGTPIYQAAGVSTGASGNAFAVDFDGSTDAFGGGSYGALADTTGTFFALFKMDSGASTDRQTIFSIGTTNTGITVEGNASNGRITAITHNGSVANAFTSYVRSMPTAGGGVDINDDQWHTLVFAKKKATATQLDDLKDVYDMYIDGLYLNDVPGFLQFIGASSDTDQWMDNLTSVADFGIGADQVNVGTDKWDGEISEVIYWGGLVLSQTEVNQMQLGLGLSIATSSTSLPALNQTISERSLTTWFKMNEASGAIVDSYGGMGNLTAAGTPDYEQTFITDMPSIGFNGTDERFRTAVSGPGIINSGYAIYHWKTSDTGLQEVFITQSPGGQPAYGLRINGSTIQLNLVNTGGFLVNEYRIDLQITGNPQTDGNWHQMIVYQPDDSTGIKIWFDGTKYTSSDSEFTEDISGASTNNNWFDTAQGNTAIGATAPTTGAQWFNGNLTNIVLSEDGGIMHDAYATALWNATGL